MQLRLEALDGHLAKNLAQLYVIASDEHLLALEAADRIRKAARAQGYTERDVLSVERTFKWGELLAPTEITLRRNIAFDESQVLAKESEEALLYRDMQSDLVQQILRRLVAIKPLAPVTAPATPAAALPTP